MTRNSTLTTFAALLTLALSVACGEEDPNTGADSSTSDGGSSDAADDIGADSAFDSDSDDDTPRDSADGSADANVGPACLDDPATGTGVGEVPEDVTLFDCEGNPHRLRDLCDARAAWVFMYTGWCPPCQENAAEAAAIAREFVGDGFAAYFVITQNGEFDEPDADYCAGIRERFGLEVPVLLDPNRALPDAVGSTFFDIDVVMGPGNEVLFTQPHALRDEVRDAIRAALAAD